MIRSRSMSSVDEISSIGTGNSVQMALEGQWDETVSIKEIHEGVVRHLSEKLERLKRKYFILKGTSDETRKSLAVKKIVAARINYQRYLNVTQDILERCNDFMKSRRDTPASRIAFVRNVQQFFSQAKDFIKLDISLKKISPTLLNYVQPRHTDSPETYRRKRDMCRVMSLVVNTDKNCLLNSTSGKTFRSRYAQQNRFLHTDFPDSWIPHLPLVLRNALRDISDGELRWLYTIVYMFSRHCTANYLQQGYCPTCMFPIVNEKGKGLSGGKLFCPACKKEIEWTYYMNPRTICIIIMSFHPLEISEVKEELKRAMDADPGSFITEETEERLYFEEVLEEYMTNFSNYVDTPSKKPPPLDNIVRPITLDRDSDVSTQEETVKNNEDFVEEKTQPDQTEEEESGGEHLPTEVGGEVEEADQTEANQYQSMVIRRASNIIRKLFGRGKPLDTRVAKESYQLYRSELSSFEGNPDDQIPRGLIPKIERYVCHYFKLPPKEEVRKTPFNEKGERRDTSRKMISEALKELGLEKYSGVISNIANKMWGSKLPNMSRHHLDILTDCVVQKEVFARLPSHGRKSSLNQRLILMYVVNRYGYKWDVSDFRVNFASHTLQKQLNILDEIFTIVDTQGNSST